MRAREEERQQLRMTATTELRLPTTPTPKVPTAADYTCIGDDINSWRTPGDFSGSTNPDDEESAPAPASTGGSCRYDLNGSTQVNLGTDIAPDNAQSTAWGR